MQNIKPVVISSGATKPGTRYKWDSMGDFIKEFTREIKSSLGDKEGQKPNISHAVSGLPSAFARSAMFTYALNSPAVEGPTSGLNAFYATLLDEWKGLVSAFVLESDSTAFQVKRVWLVYSDGDGRLENTNHIYEPKGAFGNSLFTKKQLWEDQDNIGDPDRIKRPFIDVIYYKGRVVAGTSPESLVFTAPGYVMEGIDRQKSFISETSGKFTDPTNAEGKLDTLQLNKLYSYVEKLTQRVIPFYSKYHRSKDFWPNDKVDQNLGQFLGTWKAKIKKYADDHNISLNNEAKPEVTLFDLDPFKSLFNSVNTYYANIEGVIFSDDDPGRDADSIEFKVEDLLLDSDSTLIARIDVDDLDSLPIIALEVDYSGNKLYFSIPLSPLGLRVFQRKGKLESLMKGGDPNFSSLIALYNVNNNTLDVKLELKRDGKLIAVTPTVPYKINSSGTDSALGLKQLVVWPNFVSNVWSKYYLYSEMPHNSTTGWQAYPIIGNFENEEVEVIDKKVGSKIGLNEMELPNDPNGFVRLAVDGKVTNPEKLGKLLIGNIKKTLSNFKYEIYESSKPIRGIEIRNSGKTSGFLFLKYGGSIENPSYISQLERDRKLSPTRVGIDFGSNNTCVAYDDNTTEPKILEFKNRRISFFTSDSHQNISNSIRPADTFEMLFFQNDNLKSNKVKSVLTIHDETRLIDDKSTNNTDLLFSEAIKGGVNCFETNIAIEDSTPNRHILSLQKIPDQKVQIVHNMKWSSEPREINHKIAFLKALLLPTYAELFMRKEGYLFPRTLAWAYPAAMSNSRIGKYSSDVWSPVKDCNPLLGNDYNLEVLKGSKAAVIGQSNIGGQQMSGGMGGAMSGGMGGSMGGGMSGGMSGGMGGSMGGGMSGGMGGSMGGSMGGGMSGGMGGSMGGGIGGTMLGGTQQSSPAFRDLELPEEIQTIVNPNFQFASIGQPIQISSQKAITESQAVACYASASGLNSGQFVLGFDVGGSTTDLLAVTGLNSLGAGASALVKQNSIKLAAGVLAEATKLIPGFNVFLKDYATQKIGKIYGIDSITPNTSPYFFNTVLDRLDNNADLEDFYMKIAYNSKPLMWLNLYVTGLNLFYGGMVARKLRELTEKNIGVFGRELSTIKIEFYGKGSRIFDWYKALDAQNAKNYFTQCFAKGYGEQEAYNTFNYAGSFEISNFDNYMPITTDNVKTEVAKGLAMKDFPVFEFSSQEEIAGEDGYFIRIPGQQQPIPLGSLMNINPSLIQRMGSELLPPQPGPNAYPRFVSFMNTFFDFASQTLDFKADGQEVLRAITSMNILNDLRNDEDYKEALKNGKDFDFVAPLIILQGQAFLRSYLLPKIQRG
jgi:hypothetical protein